MFVVKIPFVKMNHCGQKYTPQTHSLHFWTVQLFLNSPWRQSSWIGGWTGPSPRCSVPVVGRSCCPGRPSAAPAGTRCSWLRCAGSPLWAACGLEWRPCSVSGPQKRHLPYWVVAFLSLLRLSFCLRVLSFSCRPCRPTAGSDPLGGGQWEPSHARPPPLQWGRAVGD